MDAALLQSIQLAAQPPQLAGRTAVIIKLVLPVLEALGYTRADIECRDVDLNWPAYPAGEDKLAAGLASLRPVDAVLLSVKDAFELRVVSGHLDEVAVAGKTGLWTDGYSYACIADGQPIVRWEIASSAEPFKFLTKGSVDIAKLLASSEAARIVTLVSEFIQSELRSPSASFVNFLAQQTLGHSASADQQETLRPQVQDGLLAGCKAHLGTLPGAVVAPVAVTETEADKILAIVRGLLGENIEPARLGLRPTSGYVAILIDNNGRKQLCRLYFGPKQVGLFDAERKEERLPLPVGAIEWEAHRARLLTALAIYQPKAA